ncbi:trimeric intracellular cation channel family protein [Neisseria montereyensis]|uniref:Trimeric intracellular cation channel family protein n=1 Tax=Neisseria montereyensis TaxID=2973938 RepID=A0ABT2FEI6_9NEIS|nr:trimeric intracellular cation channel family protein [Neisseria montereyensis]MCS4534596.1 trimeric intracellular cation channel family protein [Neisseria montereyensis]
MNATEIIHMIGTAAFAMSGYLVGVRKRLDLLGVLITSILTAVGGGIIRDAIIGRIPLAFTHNTAWWVIGVTLLLSWLFKLQQSKKRELAAVFLLADSLGLVAFTITGAQAGLMMDLNIFGVVLLGFITAVGGGIVRDTLVNDIPMILRQDFYGTVSIIVGLAIYALDTLSWINPLTLNLLLVGGYLLRLWAYRVSWRLPRF